MLQYHGYARMSCEATEIARSLRSMLLSPAIFGVGRSQPVVLFDCLLEVNPIIIVVVSGYQVNQNDFLKP